VRGRGGAFESAASLLFRLLQEGTVLLIDSIVKTRARVYHIKWQPSGSGFGIAVHY
jgi:hypothetical protein